MDLQTRDAKFPCNLGAEATELNLGPVGPAGKGNNHCEAFMMVVLSICQTFWVISFAETALMFLNKSFQLFRGFY